MTNIQYKFYIGYLVILMYCLSVTAETKVCQVSKNQSTEYQETKLRFISMLFRQGDRMLDDITGQFQTNESYYPDSDGLLTDVGKRRAYELGKFLREKYNNFLGDVYFIHNVVARSTAFIRNKMTLQLILAGLYPPIHPKQKWHQKLNWQPFDISFVSLKKDALLMPHLCSKFHNVYKSIEETQSAQQQIKQLDDVIQTFSTYTKNMTKLKDLYNLYHVLTTYETVGRGVSTKLLKDAVLLYYKMCSFSKVMKKINGGTMLYRIIHDANDVINQGLDRRVNLFVGNDLNVVALLNALDIFDNEIPPFTTGVIVELYEKNKQHFVRILRYFGDVPPVLVKQKVFNCTELCPFNKFVQKTREITNTDDEHCN
ncbi:venom acid phosphatase Acph-1-like [Odontomachus brunneus]|uniref:venom acid phosphatase Acph-1-like n=1 Tax=Odontomachus brunneus TaxID=486640 RepID=UPI0013F29E80|nr:venom acid phosphatase Acph-1-like [Odontomachus brunneus]